MWSSAEARSAPVPPCICGTRTVIASSSSRADDEAEQRPQQLRGRDGASLGGRLEEAPLRDPDDDRRHGAGIEVRPEVAARRAFREDVLQAEADLLAQPGKRQAALLVVSRAEPAGEEESGELEVAFAVRAEENLHGALQL